MKLSTAMMLGSTTCTVSMCATTWGLTSGQVNQKPVINETPGNVKIVNFTYDKPASYQLEEGARLWLKFQLLVNEWNKERGASSSITEGAMARSYQEIIGMGLDAVPLILAQLHSEGDDPDQWFWALESITGENPTNPNDRGNFAKMADSWLKWGEENNVG